MTKFEELVKSITKDHIFIQTHNYPDPDALASAGGLQYLLSQKGISSTICYKGHIDKCNTLNMIQLLHIKIYPENELLLKSEDEIILVDCQKGNTNVKDFTGSEIGCIDHHKLQDTHYYRFYDIRSNLGSCSTIVASYYLENNITLTKEIATLLLYGLKMDTSNLTRGVHDFDVDIFSTLYKLADKDILLKLDSNSISLFDLNSYAKAIEDLRVYEDIGFANIGYDCSEAIIGTLSDFILTLSEVHFSMVYSYRSGGLKFSVRSDTPAYDGAKIIKAVLKDYGDGGGHALMAAGFIPDVAKDDILSIASMIEDRVVELIHSPATVSSQLNDNHPPQSK